MPKDKALTDAEWLDAEADAEIERILNMSDQEIEDELLKEAKPLDEVVADCRKIFEAAQIQVAQEERARYKGRLH